MKDNMCEHAIKSIDPDTWDETCICGIDGHYCPMVSPNLYKCKKTSVSQKSN